MVSMSSVKPFEIDQIVKFPKISVFQILTNFFQFSYCMTFWASNSIEKFFVFNLYVIWMDSSTSIGLFKLIQYIKPYKIAIVWIITDFFSGSMSHIIMRIQTIVLGMKTFIWGDFDIRTNPVSSVGLNKLIQLIITKQINSFWFFIEKFFISKLLTIE